MTLFTLRIVAGACSLAAITACVAPDVIRSENPDRPVTVGPLRCTYSSIYITYVDGFGGDAYTEGRIDCPDGTAHTCLRSQPADHCADDFERDRRRSGGYRVPDR